MIIQCMRMTPYFTDDYIYPIRIYLQKNWKFHNPNDINKKRYDSNMNSGKVIIEIVFRSLKNQKIILKIFNLSVNKAPIVAITCFVLHSYCEMWKFSKPSHVNDATRKDNLVGFRGYRLPTLKNGEQVKQEGKLMKTKLFEQWLLNHWRVSTTLYFHKRFWKN